MSVQWKQDEDDLVLEHLDRSYGGARTEVLRVGDVDGTVTVAFGEDVTVDLGGTTDLEAGEVGTAEIEDLAVTTAKIAALNVTTAKIAAQGVTFAKALVFISTQQTGTGAPQNVAHGLAVAPTGNVIIAIEAGTDGAGAAGTQCPVVTQGTHTSTNVVVTVTNGAKFRALAWA